MLSHFVLAGHFGRDRARVGNRVQLARECQRLHGGPWLTLRVQLLHWALIELQRALFVQPAVFAVFHCLQV